MHLIYPEEILKTSAKILETNWVIKFLTWPKLCILKVLWQKWITLTLVKLQITVYMQFNSTNQITLVSLKIYDIWLTHTGQLRRTCPYLGIRFHAINQPFLNQFNWNFAETIIYRLVTINQGYDFMMLICRLRFSVHLSVTARKWAWHHMRTCGSGAAKHQKNDRILKPF